MTGIDADGRGIFGSGRRPSPITPTSVAVRGGSVFAASVDHVHALEGLEAWHDADDHSGLLPISHDTGLSDVSPNDHHPEAHTVASHSDTTATGAELDDLTDGGDASALHVHATHTTAHTHASTTGRTANDHHSQSHAHNGADGSGTVAHSATTGQTSDDHHAHSLLSDTDATEEFSGRISTGAYVEHANLKVTVPNPGSGVEVDVKATVVGSFQPTDSGAAGETTRVRVLIDGNAGQRVFCTLPGLNSYTPAVAQHARTFTPGAAFDVTVEIWEFLGAATETFDFENGHLIVEMVTT